MAKLSIKGEVWNLLIALSFAASSPARIAQGIKHHMGNLYDEIGEARFKQATAAMKQSTTKTSSTEAHYKRLLFAMAFLHGLLLERNNFQQLGWLEPYHFVNNDFCVGVLGCRTGRRCILPSEI